MTIAVMKRAIIGVTSFVISCLSISLVANAYDVNSLYEEWVRVQEISAITWCLYEEKRISQEASTELQHKLFEEIGLPILTGMKMVNVETANRIIEDAGGCVAYLDQKKMTNLLLHGKHVHHPRSKN